MAKTTETNQFRAAALRHAVFCDLLLLLPPASVYQTEQFVANLALTRSELNKLKMPALAIYPATPSEYTRILDLDVDILFEKKLLDERRNAVEDVIFRFRNLRVTPDIATATRLRKFTRTEIETALANKYGEALAEIAGFYFSERWLVNLPEGCAMYAYRSELGFINGFLCQPLNRLDSYFLLSASKYDGHKAVRLTPADAKYFESYRSAPMPVSLPSPDPQADLSDFHWTGRRFAEKRRSSAI